MQNNAPVNSITAKKCATRTCSWLGQSSVGMMLLLLAPTDPYRPPKPFGEELNDISTFTFLLKLLIIFIGNLNLDKEYYCIHVPLYEGLKASVVRLFLHHTQFLHLPPRQALHIPAPLK